MCAGTQVGEATVVFIMCIMGVATVIDVSEVRVCVGVYARTCGGGRSSCGRGVE